MAELSVIRRALRDALATIPDLNVYEWVPDSIVAPAAFIQPATPFVQYQTRFGSRTAQWRFHITILLNRIEEESAQDEADMYLSPDGPVIAAVQNGDLGGAVDFATLVRGERYGSFRVGDTTYFGVELLVEITA